MSGLVCPYCRKPLDETHGPLCGAVSGAIATAIAAAFAEERRHRDDELRYINRASKARPRQFLVTSTDAPPKLVLTFSLERGAALVTNNDQANDVVLGGDASLGLHSDERWILPARTTVVVTTPAELYALGTTAGGQTLQVLDLPKGRMSDFASMIGGLIGSAAAPGIVRLQDGAGAALAALIGTSVSIAAVPSGAAAAAPANDNAGALVASRVIKAAAGTLYMLKALNTNIAARWIQLFDAAALPADATVPLISVPIAAGGYQPIDFGVYGRHFAAGIVVCNSSTAATKTIGAADSLLDAQFV